MPWDPTKKALHERFLPKEMLTLEWFQLSRRHSLQNDRKSWAWSISIISTADSQGRSAPSGVRICSMKQMEHPWRQWFEYTKRGNFLLVWLESRTESRNLLLWNEKKVSLRWMHRRTPLRPWVTCKWLSWIQWGLRLKQSHSLCQVLLPRNFCWFSIFKCQVPLETTLSDVLSNLGLVAGPHEQLVFMSEEGKRYLKGSRVGVTGGSFRVRLESTDLSSFFK